MARGTGQEAPPQTVSGIFFRIQPSLLRERHTRGPPPIRRLLPQRIPAVEPLEHRRGGHPRPASPRALAPAGRRAGHAQDHNGLPLTFAALRKVFQPVLILSAAPSRNCKSASA